MNQWYLLLRLDLRHIARLDLKALYFQKWFHDVPLRQCELAQILYLRSFLEILLLLVALFRLFSLQEQVLLFYLHFQVLFQLFLHFFLLLLLALNFLLSFPLPLEHFHFLFLRFLPLVLPSFLLRPFFLHVDLLYFRSFIIIYL